MFIMKNESPKILINLLNKASLFNAINKPMIKKLLFLMLMALNCGTIFAQDLTLSVDNSGIPEVRTFLASLRDSESHSRLTYSNADHLEDLLFKVQPSVYVTSENVATYGDNPNSLHVNSSSLNEINNSGVITDNIEIVTIRINSASELSQTIDLSLFANFTNLKYIYILSTVHTTEVTIAGLIQNDNSQYGVFYKIEEGS